MRAAIAGRVEEPVAPQHDARTRRANAAVPVDLILADHRAGLSCRQLATKYGFKSGNSISRLLKQHGEQPCAGHSHHFGPLMPDQPAVDPPAPAKRKRASRAPGGNAAWKAIDREPRWSYLELRRYLAERRLRWARNTV